MDSNLPEEKKCSACGACVNICPVGAIEMTYGNSLFISPVIDSAKCINCGLCTKTCPQLNNSNNNDQNPKVYSFCAEDKIRIESSSGGMFTTLANYVLGMGGYVCGAAFDENFKLKHIITNDSNDLVKIRKSKYLQSDVGMVYKSVKELLDNGKVVLFVGTPCQIAALKSVLVKSYENLITVDILCHGVPSQLLFDKYLEEVSHGKKVINVDFRNKRFGWNATTILITFDDGSEYIGKTRTAEKDPYYEAFLKNMMMRDICYDCKFNNYPRQGDFTIGDWWGIEKFDPTSSDKKGTSLVFINNKKSREIFDIIVKNAKYYKEIVDVDPKKIPNRVSPKTKANPSRERFLELIKSKDFFKSFELSYYNKYEIGLVSVINGDNIGSILTYYALYKTLTDMGYTVLPIERPFNSSLPCNENAKKFTAKWLPNYSQPVQYDSLMEMRELNDICDMFMVGSDQIYLAMMSEKRQNFFFLQWVEDNKKKIGFSSSFGGPGARGTEAYYRELKYYLNRFDFLSCREDDGVKFANNDLELNKKILWSIDPVFLCNRKHYMDLIENVNKKRNEDYIGSYIVIPKLHMKNLIKRTKERMKIENVEVIVTDGKQEQAKDFWEFDIKGSFPICNTLEMIYNCQFFVTDSFHGVCFAIIFKKDFLVIPRDFTDRFTSLLDRIGLGDRIINTNLKNLKEESFEKIDYDKVYKLLDAEIENSKNMLNDVLLKKANNEYTDYDILMKYIKIQADEIKKMKKEMETNSSVVDDIINLGHKYT